MNFRNRYLVIAVRILLGLIMLASGISGLLMGNSTQGAPAKMVAHTQVFWALGIFQTTSGIAGVSTRIQGRVEPPRILLTYGI